MKIISLLIGINEYPSKPLRGCLNDIKAVEKYLQETYKADELKIFKLLDSQATRQGIIDAFNCFDEAEDGDTCLLYYSGHGSYMPAAQEFWTETDGLLETLVCYDSRTGNGRDLANKELGFLIWQHSFGKKINFVVITDSCHSGSVTRELLEENIWRTDRTTPNRNDTMPVESFYGFDMQVNGQKGYFDITENGKRKVSIPVANHIHLAASRDNQTAKEDQILGQHHGIFTYSLLQTLYQNAGKISYESLIDLTNTKVKHLALDQDSSLNIIGLDAADAQKTFLGNEFRKASEKVQKLFFDKENGWSINGGGVNGFQLGDIIKINGKPDAKISELNLDTSKVSLADNHGLDEKETYEVKIIKNKRLAVSFGWFDKFKWPWESDVAAIKEKAKIANDFYLVDDDSGTFFIQERDENGKAMLFLTHKNSKHALFEKIDWASPNAFENLVTNIDIVCRWYLLKDLNNTNSQINDTNFELKIEEQGIGLAKPIDGGYNFYYKFDAQSQKWKAPKLKFTIQNKLLGKTLIAKPIYLGFDYGVDTTTFNKLTLNEAVQSLNYTKAGKTEEIVSFVLDKKYANLGFNQITEYFKIFVSTKELNLDAHRQPGISLEKVQGIDRDLANRSLMTDPDEEEEMDDWQAFTLKLTITKTVEEELGQAEAIKFNSGLSLKKSASFSGKIGFSTTNELKQRSLAGLQNTNDRQQVHEIKGNDALLPAELVANHGQGQSLNIIEIFDARNTNAVNYASPLEIIPQQPIAENETILPFGYDEATKTYFPLGNTDINGNIIINQLPEETASDAAITQRSLLGSIKIYFYKVIGQRIGIKYEYPQLTIANVSADEKVTYEKEPAIVKEAVKKAKNILVFIHGIIGDTEGMVKVVQKAKTPKGKLLISDYDLVLAFDYENLSTKIQDTAADLKKRLTEAGLGEKHGKKLVIVAHSMGGLVSRYFIEKLNGAIQVSHLIMLGTPNGGSEWADVRDLAEVLLSKAVNGAAFLKPWLIPLSFVGRMLNGVQVTLKQMNDNSDFMAELNDQTAPNTKYSIIAGNTQLITNFKDQQAGFFKKVIMRLKEKPAYAALDLLVFKEANDIAVKVQNISNIKGQKPAVIEVASDHISYFGEEVSYRELGKLL